jgi:hypothetical protein
MLFILTFIAMVISVYPFSQKTGPQHSQFSQFVLALSACFPAAKKRDHHRIFLFMCKHVIRIQNSQAPVAHACNSSYSEGRDQEDCGLKPAWANSSRDCILEKPFTKIGLVEWLKVKALSSNPRYHTHTKRIQRKQNGSIIMILDATVIFLSENYPTEKNEHFHHLVFKL